MINTNETKEQKLNNTPIDELKNENEKLQCKCQCQNVFFLESQNVQLLEFNVQKI